MKSDAWAVKKMDKCSVAEYKCCVCGNLNDLEVHHKTYKRLGREKLSDLVLLCKYCHKELHRRVCNKESGLSKTIRRMRWQKKQS